LRAANSTDPTTPFNSAKRRIPWIQAYSGARSGENRSALP